MDSHSVADGQPALRHSPVQCLYTATPPSPTANTSFSRDPDTAYSAAVVGTDALTTAAPS